MITTLLARTRLVVTTLATIGLLTGVLVAYVTVREERFMARATLAMLPAPEVPPEAALNFWEVLNRGQATRTAAIALEDPRWLGVAAEETNVSESELALSAGAIPNTTLINVTMEANSKWVAEQALNTVLKAGVSYAATVSGPFKLETITAVDGKADPMGPDRIKTLATLGIAGLLIGAGAGLFISRSAQGWMARRGRRPKHKQPASPIAEVDGEPIGVKRNGQPLSVEI